MQRKTFEVPNISCDNCVQTVLSELSDLEGVTKVEANEATRMVTVHWDNPATWEKIKAVLTEINYPPAPSA